MLPDAERFRLIRGPYRPPRYKIGSWIVCRLRGRVKVVGMTDAPIQWPLVVDAKGGGGRIALCGDLVKAVRQESTKAIQHWWGVKSNTVWTWRKTLGVDQNNAGTIRLRSKWWTDGGTGEASRPGREASFQSPERAAKIAAARRGIPRPPHVRAAMLRGKPFTAEEDALIGTMTDVAVAAIIGRRSSTIAGRRKRLGIASFRKQTRGR